MCCRSNKATGYRPCPQFSGVLWLSANILGHPQEQTMTRCVTVCVCVWLCVCVWGVCLFIGTIPDCIFVWVGGKRVSILLISRATVSGWECTPDYTCACFRFILYSWLHVQLFQVETLLCVQLFHIESILLITRATVYDWCCSRNYTFAIVSVWCCVRAARTLS